MFNLFFKAKEYDLDGAEFKSKYKAAKGILVDVRTPGEFQMGSIRGARNIDFMSPNFMERFTQLDKDKEYFLFCRSGARSGNACSMLIKQGYKVYNLASGIGGWPE